MVKVIDQKITEKYALYNGDCIPVMEGLPDKSIHFSIYSPPFGGLYNYSSSPRDLSNCTSYEQFFEHYKFCVEQIHRVTMPGRLTAVHCMDVPVNMDHQKDFPGDIIKLHESIGWKYCARYAIWKEPLGVRNRTMAKGLAHKQIVVDSTLCDVASADYLVLFRKGGKNQIPVTHPTGLERYAGERKMPEELLKYKNWKGNQIENRYSHWIWRQYASAFWDDVRIDRVLPYRESKDPEDERHVHPLQLDVIERSVVLRTNPGEVVLTPFLGVGSEAYGAVINGRRAVGIELKSAYYKQALKNMESAAEYKEETEAMLFDETKTADARIVEDDE